MWNVKRARVCGLNGLSVWHANVNAIGRGSAIKARAVDGEEVASAGRVGKCSRGWGTVTIVANCVATRVTRTSARVDWCNCPEESVGGGTVFVFLRSTHGVHTGGAALVAVGREMAGVAIMAGINVVPMGPAVVQVGEPFGTRGVARMRRRGGRGVARGTIVVATVVGGVVGTIVEAGLVLLDLVAEFSEFGIFDGDLLKQGLVGGLETAKEVTVGGGGQGQVGKGVGGFVGKGFHGVVGLLESSCGRGGAEVG